MRRVKKTKRPTEDWVRAKVQQITLAVGVTKENFEQARQVVKLRTHNAIHLEMSRYESGMAPNIRRQQQSAGIFRYSSVGKAWANEFEFQSRKLQSFGVKVVDEVFERIFQDGFVQAAAYWDLGTNIGWVPLANRPLAPTSEMSPIEAEHWVTNLLLFLGASGATTTQYSQDGGVDCQADDYVAQVKHLSKPVSVGAIREIFAVGVAKGKTPLMFSKSGFTAAAIDFAIEYHVLLFSYLPLLRGHTKTSNKALEMGLTIVPEVPVEGLRRAEKRDRPRR